MYIYIYIYICIYGVRDRRLEFEHLLYAGRCKGAFGYNKVSSLERASSKIGHMARVRVPCVAVWTFPTIDKYGESTKREQTQQFFSIKSI